MVRRSAWLLAFAAASAGAATPAPGRYAATFCVAPSPSQPASCGPAVLDVRSRTSAALQMSDVVYRLALRPQRIDVATFQERMQIDGFSAEYEWIGPLLRFVDVEKNVRYEIRPGRRLGRPH